MQTPKIQLMPQKGGEFFAYPRIFGGVFKVTSVENLIISVCAGEITNQVKKNWFLPQKTQI
jgi:hypothetical protein